jgi:hypothetical protein
LLFFYTQRPFFKSLCFCFLLVLWGRLLFPTSPMPAGRWRNPPAKPQARATQELESKPESDPGADPRVRVQGRVRFALDLGARKHTESDFFGPGLLSPSDS